MMMLILQSALSLAVTGLMQRKIEVACYLSGQMQHKYVQAHVCWNSKMRT